MQQSRPKKMKNQLGQDVQVFAIQQWKRQYKIVSLHIITATQNVFAVKEEVETINFSRYKDIN